MGVIKQLKQFITGTQIFPITKVRAVYDDNGNRLDQRLDELRNQIENAPKNADTLSGYPAAYFAKQNDLEALRAEINALKNK